MTEPNAPAAVADKANQPAGGAVPNPQAPSNLPEKFKGKSAEQIAQSYLELEKQMGEKSKTIEETNKLKGEMDTLLKAIWVNPDLYKDVEEAVIKFSRGEVLPNRSNIPPKKSDDAPKSDLNPTVSELKTAEENRVLNEFYGKYGYNNLEPQAQKDARAKLAAAVAELVDPGGTKTIRQVFDSIPVTKLSRFLENAHFIANKSSIAQQMRDAAAREENESGAIGSFAAASSADRSQSVKLTPREREVARKQGISEEEYAKQKAKILKDRERYS